SSSRPRSPPRPASPSAPSGRPCCRGARRRRAGAGHEPAGRPGRGGARGGPSEVRPGDPLPEVAETIERLDLVRYAGASGDFNPIHWNDEVARAVGLPGVIAHGMYSMGVAARMVTAWAGD